MLFALRLGGFLFGVLSLLFLLGLFLFFRLFLFFFGFFLRVLGRLLFLLLLFQLVGRRPRRGRRCLGELFSNRVGLWRLRLGRLGRRRCFRGLGRFGDRFGLGWFRLRRRRGRENGFGLLRLLDGLDFSGLFGGLRFQFL